MLGIIVEAETDAPGTGLIFHKFGQKTVLERVLEACLGCFYASKVILAMPTADRVLISGSVFQSKLSGKLDALEKFGRKADHFFYGRSEMRLERFHRAALNFQLDDLIIVSAKNVLMQSWFLNYVAQTYLEAGARNVIKTNLYPTWMQAQAFPFWRLARVCAKTDFSAQDVVGPEMELPNAPPYHLPIPMDNGVPQSFALNEHANLSILSRIIEELDVGADLGDLLEDFVEQAAD